MEYTKNFIDQINAWHSLEPSRFSVTEMTKSTYALHYYESIVVIEKRPIDKPFGVTTGTATVPNHYTIRNVFARLKSRLKQKLTRE